MENAQKALIIAATILITIMVIGIFVYVFRAGGDFSASFDKKQLSGQLELYNSRFEVYNKPDNTIMDLITVCNLAYSVNSDCEYNESSTVKIEIEFDGQKLVIPDTADLGYKLKKNQIYLNNEIISLFNLCENPINKLKEDNYQSTIEDNKNKLNKTHLGTIKYKDPSDNHKELSKYATIYKYYFNCTNMEYHINDTGSNAKVKYMKFERNVFPEGSEKYWNPDWNNE